MSSSNNQPDALSMPFANNGDKSTIPSSATGTNKASLTEGFPQITSESIADGGIPPSREDFNALGNISTSHNYFMQNGGGYTFVPAVSTAIGGYPKGALLWYRPSTGNPQLLVSTKNNNKDNFNTNQSYIGTEGSGKSWEIVTVSGSNYVDLTSNQTIAGSKTFVSTLQTTTNIVYKRNAITKGTNPESTQNWQFFFADKNGSGDANALGKIQTSVDSTGLVTTSMYALKNASGTSSARIAICYPSSGSAYTYAPTPATSDNSTKIATTAFVKAQGYALDSDVVKLTGNQTIAGTKEFSSTISGSIDGNAATVTNGVYTTGNQTIGGTKTFTSNITIKKSNPTLQQDNTSITKGTVPTSGGTPTNNNTYSISYRDNDGKNVGSLIYHYNTNKDVHARLYVYKSSASTDTADVYLRVYYNADGNYGILLSADNADNDTNQSLTKVTTSVNDITIPCMGWVNKVLNTSGRGLATFSKSANGYYKFTNGLIIQWGTTTTADNETTITLPTAFTSTNYAVSCTVIANNAAYQRTLKNDNSRTTTAFTTYMSGVNGNSNFTWIAIGY